MEAYIPDNNGAGPPARTALDVLREGDVVVKELQEEVRLFFLVADNIAGDCLWLVCGVASRVGMSLTLRVNVEGFLSGDLYRPPLALL